MKKTVLILALLALIGAGLVVFGTEDYVQTVALESVAEGTAPMASDTMRQDENLLLSIAYDGITLPVNEDGTVLIPIIPESGVTVTTEKGATVTRSESVFTGESGTYRSIAFTVSKGGFTRTVTLTETHMAVAYLSVNEPEISKDTEPFGEKKKRAGIVMLSANETGSLLKETGTIDVKWRGNSSRVYAKKGYTFTNIDENGNETARSFLGFPADTKFGLNSLFEDDVKLRDILSLDICASTLPEGTRDRVLTMQYTELYVNGFYRGLYGMKQILSPASVAIGQADGLVKVNTDFSLESPLKPWQLRSIRRGLDVRRELPEGSVADLFMSILEKINDSDPSALELINRESLLRYALWVQVLCSHCSTSKNVVGIWHTDEQRFSLTIYDTDQTFGFSWDSSNPPGYCSAFPELAQKDIFTDTDPLGRLMQLDPANMAALAELYFSMRDNILSEETLLRRARFLFASITESGAASRDHRCWPTSPLAGSCAQVETFITERLAWCDNYFAAYLEDKAA